MFLDLHFLNAGPYNFWIGIGIIIIIIGFILGYFFTFWGSIYFLLSNLLIYLFFYIISYTLLNFSQDLWNYLVDNESILLVSIKTKQYVTNALPILILIISLVVINLFLLLLYFLLIKKHIKNRHITLLNRFIGSFIGGSQSFLFVCFIFGIIGSGIFYTNSANFDQNLAIIMKDPSLLNYKYNNISATIFYKIFIILNKY